ncbi:MAG: DISARM system SNF2-like helicase DrmD [Actinomycetota bacterium]
MITSSQAQEASSVPEVGQLVAVRDRQWVVSDVSRGTQASDALATQQEPPQHLLTLASIEEDAAGEELQVIWELEPGRRVFEHGALPTPDPDRFDPPERLDAFLDAVRWGAIASADPRYLQAPFRAGITIEDYQLDPVVRALRMPRVNLLIADDVGLGKTIEAGLVIQELLLRHRARTVLVVCPASLTIKWQNEMAEKFGLEFRIVDRPLLHQLRRTRGLYANPFTHFPRLIVSIDYLKRDRVMRLLKEVLPARPAYPRKFDLLIVDEAHGVAPSGRGKYATDSQRTRAVRAIGQHFEHRLFLTATPHNGYKESFSALLEILDNQRFARGVQWSDEQLRRVMVRRLKSELPGFPERKIEPIEVAYTDEEREVYAKLRRYGELRLTAAERAENEGARLAEKFVFTLLKKRLFSSPAAFAETLAVHRETASGQKAERALRPTTQVLRRTIDEVEADHGDEAGQHEATTDALAVAARASAALTDEQAAILNELQAWAARARGRSDTKADTFLASLADIVRPAGPDGERRWANERVIVFTEYRDTQRWLHERMAARDLAGDHVALLYGGMDDVQRERIKAEFQASPELSPIRILLATDAASEGIDLQRHCHRLVHYEIPWNPNRLEQRNGRIDRHGQPSPEVLIYHFVSAGFEQAEPGSLDGDLEFLSTAIRKVEAIREDLGSVGPVIAQQVEEAMIGARTSLQTDETERRAVSRRVLKVERDLREEIRRLRERLDDTVRELKINPASVERVVRTALELARQPQLEERVLERQDGSRVRVLALPQLTGSWARCADGLAHPVTNEIRPITFDHDVASDHDDVVLVHLQHRLVQQSMRLLRAEIWAAEAAARLARVTAKRVAPGALPGPAVVALGRLVITGGDGHRLHEEVIAAGGLLKEGRLGRFNVTETEDALGAATTDSADPLAYRELAAAWDRYRDSLFGALERRGRDRAESLQKSLQDRAQEEVDTITHVLTELRRTIEMELKEPEPEQLALFSPDEREQLRRDIDALKQRLETIPQDIEAETEAIRRRYADPEPRLFPAAVTFLIPDEGL